MEKFNKNIIITIISLLLLSSLSRAQTKIWEKDIDLNYAFTMSMINIPGTNNVVVNGFQPGNDPTQIISDFNGQGNLNWQMETWSSRTTSIHDNDIIVSDSGQIIILLDRQGNIVQTIPLPEIIAVNHYVGYISLNSDGNYYMLSTKTDWTLDEWKVFIYDHNFNFIRSFPVIDSQSGDVESFVVNNGDIYISRWRYGAGISSNMISNVYKYDSSGNLLWNKELMDRGDAYITIDENNDLYCAASSLWRDSINPIIHWETMKLDPNNGNTLWDTPWLGRGDDWRTGLYPRNVYPLPGGGCLTIGESNKEGYYDYYNLMAIAYSSSGDSLWSIEVDETVNRGTFEVGAWDNDNALILVGNVDDDYKIFKYHIDGITAVREEGSSLPREYSLSQNYPNPFSKGSGGNPTTTIEYSIPAVMAKNFSPQRNVQLKIYDILGREVATLVNKNQTPGNYSVKFNASNLPSGVYIYRITVGSNFVETKKMTLLK